MTADQDAQAFAALDGLYREAAAGSGIHLGRREITDARDCIQKALTESSARPALTPEQALLAIRAFEFPPTEGWPIDEDEEAVIATLRTIAEGASS